MAKPYLIIVGGIPGVGKTTLGKKLSESLKIPFLNKDSVIEVLFEEIGVEEQERNIPNLRTATYRILSNFAEQLGKSGQSVILEGNFNSESGIPELKELVGKGFFETLPILCEC